MPTPKTRKPSGRTLPSGRTTTRAISSGRMRPSEVDTPRGVPAARRRYTCLGNRDVHGLLASLCEQLEKGLHEFRVELAAGLAAELLDGLRLRQPARVGAPGCHRVERVAQEHDARGERDRLAREAVGVAAAIEALVARADDAGVKRERRG